MKRLWLLGVTGGCLMVFGAFLQWLNRGSRVTLLDIQWHPWPTVATYFGSPGSGSANLHSFGLALLAVGTALGAVAIVVLLRRREVARLVTGEAHGNT